jgi:putative NADH-flavin reductase
MKVTVLGASGKIGKRVVTQLLHSNIGVVAFIHGENLFSEHPHLRIIQGDVHNKKDLSDSLTGSSAVISTLGSWHTPTKDILSSAMAGLLPAMEKHKIKRIITLTGADARVSTDHPPVLDRVFRMLLSKVASDILIDGEKHVELLENSATDWTAIRSPVMRSWGFTQKYKVSLSKPRPWQTVHRDDVVDAMCSQLKDDSFIRAAPYLNK